LREAERERIIVAVRVIAEPKRRVRG